MLALFLALLLALVNAGLLPASVLPSGASGATTNSVVGGGPTGSGATQNSVVGGGPTGSGVTANSVVGGGPTGGGSNGG